MTGKSPETLGRRCVACGAEAPQTETTYTLISASHGWRLQRVVSDDGTLKLDWRCAKCWDTYKKKTGKSIR